MAGGRSGRRREGAVAGGQETAGVLGEGGGEGGGGGGRNGGKEEG